MVIFHSYVSLPEGTPNILAAGVGGTLATPHGNLEAGENLGGGGIWWNP